MGLDSFTMLFNSLIVFIYGSICIISAIFTFSIERYRKFDEILNLDIIASRFLTPLDINLEIIDEWLFAHNKSIGPVLILLSLLNAKLYFDVVKLF